MGKSNGIWTGSLCREIKLESPEVDSGLFINCLRLSLVPRRVRTVERRKETLSQAGVEPEVPEW